MKASAPTLGIDFGTSNSAAALRRTDGTLHTLMLDGARAEMPTALFFASESHSVLYGSQAVQAYLQGQEGRLLRALKSLLGSRLMDEYTAVNGQSVRYFDILVLFFQELKRRCEAVLGSPVTHAVLGRPVHFVDDDPARDALAEETLGRAARAAGLSELRFIMEPVAAALDYAQRISRPTRVLVVDIGGGTSDFTVMQLQPQGRAEAHQILATSGVHLGGTDFDRLLDLDSVMPLLGYRHLGPSGRPMPSSVFFDLSTWHLIHQAYTRRALHFAQELWTDYADLALHARLMDALEGQHGHRILAQVEAAKIACSTSAQDSPIDLDFLRHDPTTHLGAHISAAGMAQALADALARIVQCAQDCVRQSGLAAVDAVYLTGGSSALAPLVQALRRSMPEATLVEGNRFGGVAAGLAQAAA